MNVKKIKAIKINYFQNFLKNSNFGKFLFQIKYLFTLCSTTLIINNLLATKQNRLSSRFQIHPQNNLTFYPPIQPPLGPLEHQYISHTLERPQPKNTAVILPPAPPASVSTGTTNNGVVGSGTATSGTISSGTGGPAVCWPSSGVGSSIASGSGLDFEGGGNKVFKKYSSKTDKFLILCAMADPKDGIECSVKSWIPEHGNIIFSGNFNNGIIFYIILASELIKWLQKHIMDLENFSDCEKFASDLIYERLIIPAINKDTFTKETFYKFNDNLRCKFLRKFLFYFLYF